MVAATVDQPPDILRLADFYREVVNVIVSAPLNAALNNYVIPRTS
jgi:hypothetical protein